MDKVSINSLSLDLLDKADGHKYDYGHALVITGGRGKTGATRLAARGALRVGAGLVTLACPPEASAEVAAQITALMMTQVTDDQALKQVLEDHRINALVIGPGLGLEDAKADLVRAVLLARRGTVLDADALTLIARHPTLFDLLHNKCVLTPHEGEFRRLFPELFPKSDPKSETDCIEARKQRLEQAVVRAQCCILSKGAATLIAGPETDVVLHHARGPDAAPWLATAGSGDVLSGFIGGLLARGASPVQAAIHGAWLHAECARSYGPGLIAEDLPEVLPLVFKGLLNGA